MDLSSTKKVFSKTHAVIRKILKDRVSNYNPKETVCRLFDSKGYTYTIAEDGSTFTITACPDASIVGKLNNQFYNLDTRFIYKGKEYGKKEMRDLSLECSNCSIELEYLELYLPALDTMIEALKEMTEEFKEDERKHMSRDLINSLLQPIIKEYKIRDKIEVILRSKEFYLEAKVNHNLAMYIKISADNCIERCHEFCRAYKSIPKEFKDKYCSRICFYTGEYSCSEKVQNCLSWTDEEVKMDYDQDFLNDLEIPAPPELGDNVLYQTLHRLGFKFYTENNYLHIIICKGLELVRDETSHKILHEGYHHFHCLKDFIYHDEQMITLLNFFSKASSKFKEYPKYYLYHVCLPFLPDGTRYSAYGGFIVIQMGKDYYIDFNCDTSAYFPTMELLIRNWELFSNLFTPRPEYPNTWYEIKKYN